MPQWFRISRPAAASLIGDGVAFKQYTNITRRIESPTDTLPLLPRWTLRSSSPLRRFLLTAIRRSLPDSQRILRHQILDRDRAVFLKGNGWDTVADMTISNEYLPHAQLLELQTIMMSKTRRELGKPRNFGYEKVV